MEVIFLGTGTSQGVPVIACNCKVCKSKDPKDNRLRSSIIVNTNSNTILIDSGPDFRQQMLRENIDDLDAILYTHSHKDHISGLDDVRAFNFKWRKDMQLYCTTEVKDALHREYHYMFKINKYPGVPNVNINLIRNKKFTIGNDEILPIEGLHYKMPVFGYRIKNFAYMTDVSFISKNELEKLKDLKVLVLDCLRKEPNMSHFNLDQAIDLVNYLKPKKTFLIHISHLMGLHSKVSAELPENIHLSYDGLRLTI